MTQKIRFLFSCIMFILGVVVGLISVFTIYRILTKNMWYKIFVINWAKYMLWSLGIKVDINNSKELKYLSGNIIIANHLSWVDILLILSISRVSFISMAEIKSWPIISTMAKSIGTIFINRQSRGDIIKVNLEIKEALKQKQSNIAIFPEGKIAPANHMLEFKSGLFQSALELECDIALFGIDYLLEDNTVAYAANYYGNIGIIQCLSNILKTPKIIAKISYETIKTNTATDREELASFCHNKIKKLKQGNFHGITTKD